MHKDNALLVVSTSSPQTPMNPSGFPACIQVAFPVQSMHQTKGLLL